MKSLLHLTHNHVRQRMRVFFLSYGLLVLMWGWLLVRLVMGANPQW